MGGLLRLEVQSLNQKSLLILGLITNILAQRIDGFGEAGGAREIRTVGAIYLCLSAARSQLSHYVARNPVDLTRRLSSCRFHGASTSEITSQIGNSKKPSKTMRSQGLKTWLRG
jgi:hypothetical protein